MTSDELIERMYGLVRQGQDNAAIDLLKKYKSSNYKYEMPISNIELEFDPHAKCEIPNVYFDNNQLVIDDCGWDIEEGVIEECIGYVRYMMTDNNFHIVQNAEAFLRDCVKIGRVKKTNV